MSTLLLLLLSLKRQSLIKDHQRWGVGEKVEPGRPFLSLSGLFKKVTSDRGRARICQRAFLSLSVFLFLLIFSTHDNDDRVLEGPPAWPRRLLGMWQVETRLIIDLSLICLI